MRSSCEHALAKDPQHLDAHRLLAVALAQTGDHAAAVDHIVTAIAGDYCKYGAALATDPDLEAFRATPHGQAVSALAARIHDEYVRRIKSGLWLVGRRSTFKWPAKDGVQPSSSRGELYAYDRETQALSAPHAHRSSGRRLRARAVGRRGRGARLRQGRSSEG